MSTPRPLSDDTLYASPTRMHEFALEHKARAVACAPHSPRRLRQAYVQGMKGLLPGKPELEKTVSPATQRMRANLCRPEQPEADDWLEQGSRWLSIMASVLGIMVLALLLILAWLPMAQANDLRGDDNPRGLQLRDAKTGLSVSALDLGADVSMQVSGLLARVTVTQTYQNPTAHWQEGMYLFPLPERAAVDHLRMHIGERIIEGQIKEKQQARATYEKAKAEGKRTGLVQQKRANMFTTEVANIGPGETVKIEIQYQQTLSYQDSLFELRFPMVVGPRYIAKPVRIEGFDGGGFAAAQAIVDEPVPAVPYQQETAQRLAFNIDLDAGMPLAKVESPYHPIHSTQTGVGRYQIKLAEGGVPVNRDFVLRWVPEASAAPRAALFTQTTAEANYALLLFVPPAEEMAEANVIAREVIYMIDTSGSMHGPSIIQARQALDLALTQLRDTDRFNVIQFNSTMDTLFPQAVPASPANLQRARDYVARLEANGGTEMAPALQAALAAQSSGERVRQVVFLTDGSVGNEQELFALIRTRLGDSRLFTVGIGSAPNSHFMREAARFGRGTFTFIGDTGEVANQMGNLFRKLQSPVLKDIRVDWPQGMAVDMLPDRIPDLYAGEPLLLQAKLDSLKGAVRLSGQGMAQAWSVDMPLAKGADRTGVDVAWARAKLAGLEDKLGNDTDQSVQQQMTALAIQHHLVSRFTSLVAVDVTPARPSETDLKSGKLPLAMPHGWDMQKVFGGLPQTATPAALHLLYGLFALCSGLGVWWRSRRAC